MLNVVPLGNTLFGPVLVHAIHVLADFLPGVDTRHLKELLDLVIHEEAIEMDGMDGVAGTPIDIRKGLVKILLKLFVSRVSLVEVIDDPGSI